ncbi:hypothetical protein D3C74_310770 [compost metagenome]
MMFAKPILCLNLPSGSRQHCIEKRTIAAETHRCQLFLAQIHYRRTEDAGQRNILPGVVHNLQQRKGNFHLGSLKISFVLIPICRNALQAQFFDHQRSPDPRRPQENDNVSVNNRPHDLQGFIIDHQRLTAAHAGHLGDAPDDGSCFKLCGFTFHCFIFLRRKLSVLCRFLST